MGNRDTGELNEINLEQTLLIGDELDLFDGSDGAISRHTEIGWSLERPCVRVIAEASEAGGNRISPIEGLYVGGCELDI
jgi:hypothetical protein